jgi:hypothetical protein
MLHTVNSFYQNIAIRMKGLFILPGIRVVEIILVIITGLILGLLLVVSPLLALGVTLSTIFVLAALLKPILLCYLAIVAIALTSGMQRGKLIPFLIPNEAVLLLSIGLALIILLARKRQHSANLSLINIAIILLILGTVLVPGISYLLRGTTFTVRDVLTLLSPIQFVLLFWLFSNIPENNVERQWVLKLMLLCGTLVAAVGLLQAAGINFITSFLNQWYSSAHELKAADYGRITSLMSAWNGLGIFLMVNILIAWAFGISRPADLGYGIIAAAMILCTVALLITGSYASMIGAVIGILILTLLLRGINRKTVVLLLGLTSAVILTLMVFQAFILKRFESQFGYGGSVPATLLDRFRIWQEIYIPAVQQNPIWGVYLTIPETYAWQYTESQYLTLLFCFGLVGLTAFLLWVGITLIWLIRRFRQHDGLLKPVAAIAFSIILVLSIAGFTNAVFTYSGTAEYMWILLALATYRPEMRA